MTLTKLVTEVATGRRGKRFAALMYLLRGMATKCGWPLSPEERRLLDALWDVERLSHCYAEIAGLERPLFFDLLRFSFDDVQMLLKKVRTDDCYWFGLVDRDDPVVLDVGAYIGVFSRWVLERKPKSRVYALEPNRESCTLLGMNLRDYAGASYFQRGLLDRRTELELFTSGQRDWRSTFVLERGVENKRSGTPDEFRAAYKVEITSIDDLAVELSLDRLDMIKIAVPGGIERPILEGAIRTINRFQPQVSISVGRENVAGVQAYFAGVDGYTEEVRGVAGVYVYAPVRRGVSVERHPCHV